MSHCVQSKDMINIHVETTPPLPYLRHAAAQLLSCVSTYIERRGMRHGPRSTRSPRVRVCETYSRQKETISNISHITHHEYTLHTGTSPLSPHGTTLSRLPIGRKVRAARLTYSPCARHTADRGKTSNILRIRHTSRIHTLHTPQAPLLLSPPRDA